MKEHIGIFGGSFNPIHNGHLIIARDAMKHFNFTEVLFVPCNQPSHKANILVSPAHRLAMLELALREEAGFKLSDVDIRRGGVTYSIDTVRDLKRERPEADLSFIIGSDTLRELYQWHAIDELFALCRFAVMVRPGFDPEAMPEDLGLAPSWRDRLFQNTVMGGQSAISSSEIRKRIAKGISIKHMVPREVEAYIADHALYRKQNIKI